MYIFIPEVAMPGFCLVQFLQTVRREGSGQLEEDVTDEGDYPRGRRRTSDRRTDQYSGASGEANKWLPSTRWVTLTPNSTSGKL